MTDDGGRLDLAEQIRSARKRKKLTQEQAARLAGVDRKHYWKLEKAKGDVTVETLRRIVTALEIDTVTLGPARVVRVADPRSELLKACQTAIATLNDVMRLVREQPDLSKDELAAVQQVLTRTASQPMPAPIDESHPAVREYSKTTGSERERK